MKSIVFGGGSGSPDSNEWHVWRAAGIGGSDSIVIGAGAGLVHPAPSWVKPVQWLWEVKTGRRSGVIPSNPAMQRGKDGEAPAREAFIAKTGITILPMFGEMDAYPFVRASFDGVSFCQKILGEIKCPGEKTHADVALGKVPPHYIVQMAHQGLTLWGHPDEWPVDAQGFYISYHPETEDMKYLNMVKDGGYYIPLVSMMKETARKLLPELQTFWMNVSNQTLPCGAAWMAAANQYLAIEQELDDAKTRLEIAKTRLVTLLGDKPKEVGGGLSVIRSTRKGSVDYPELIKILLPDIKEDQIDSFRKKGTESISIRKTMEADFNL
ncbi:lambda-exonuclease family protein [Ferrovum myxofaciens]|uniref:YqaJ viral recombinase family protein n=1 Tax=Ferrovum myxofaciens TaxID=416213 RepID=A0A9E6MWY9_9PROT|nr:YqaJ viral recombinase family protein [Ferrovum myxofaciens]QKE37462.1 MAG: YqaJ viral recombinase family protein [Ferrovum myxofaciens]QWY75110.1 MAG: YqaJ viral recombinase family protein [Ferrovum myxofaciens]QWY77845.1 MAG: YqaJ viral recombinase family protein [Ferrovum myxofaciens]